eukprot:CAMPEP_0204079892 /NCGR_PEP_ID=MMETSP0360-20130528/173090_1 /ASSEMBLY_ACC=CAM_ASM_000342 /TAXON_ID=268821 /ORGANISM="Scrippsiella Hangoei, Strain SHTV-5" /LENGTH=489 /DNA_ID=CAMNT_0051028645 /DNA_START=11 /DNA_END=1479 /DNA_ORIENTATION=-
MSALSEQHPASCWTESTFVMPLCSWPFGTAGCFMSVATTEGAKDKRESVISDRLNSYNPQTGFSSRPSGILKSDRSLSCGSAAPSFGKQGSLSDLQPSPQPDTTMGMKNCPPVAAPSASAPTRPLTPSGCTDGGKIAAHSNKHAAKEVAERSGEEEVNRVAAVQKQRFIVEDIMLSTALRAGRWIEARQRLESLEAAGTSEAVQYLDDSTMERLRRINARFEDSLHELKPKEQDGWILNQTANHGLDFRFRLTSRTLEVVSSKVFEGVDALHAFIGLCEFDLQRKYDKQILDVQTLEQVGTGDSLWRIVKQVAVAKEDNVLHVSCIDALDEPLGALWVSTYTPVLLAASNRNEATSGSGDRHPVEACGVTLPAPQDGVSAFGVVEDGLRRYTGMEGDAWDHASHAGVQVDLRLVSASLASSLRIPCIYAPGGRRFLSEVSDFFAGQWRPELAGIVLSQCRDVRMRAKASCRESATSGCATYAIEAPSTS